MLEWPDDTISIDEILTNVSLYWFTETMPRCIYTYRGTFINGHQYKFPPFQQPFGYSWFMRELVPGPRNVVEGKGNLVFYQQHEKVRADMELPIHTEKELTFGVGRAFCGSGETCGISSGS